MRHDVRERPVKGASSKSLSWWEKMFAPRGLAALQRGARHPAILELPDEATQLALFERAKTELSLASEEACRRMLAKNPDIVRVIRTEPGGTPRGLFAFLPLNEFGLACVANGSFDGAAPDPAYICGPGETPAALYEWLFYGPGLYFQVLPAIGEIYRALAPDGCMLFSKGTTDASSAILDKLGFLRARLLYPEAPEAMVVLLPQSDVGQTRPKVRPKIEVRQVRDFEGLAHVISVRSATYLAEQFPLYSEEFDGNDFCATHFVGYVDGDPAGAIRMRYFADFVKVERLAVKLEYRKTRLAFMLVKQVIAHMRQKGFTRAYGHASDEIAPFWKLMGGRDVDGRPKFRFANIEYREMVADFPPDPLAIRLGAPPMVTIRPEGAWDVPAPLDWSNVQSDPARIELMAQYSSKKKIPA